jgi:hypothetical protein
MLSKLGGIISLAVSITDKGRVSDYFLYINIIMVYEQIS